MSNICTRCVMDISVPEIKFDGDGVCQYCKIHDEMEKDYPSDPDLQKQKLDSLVEKIKQSGKGKKYDCICGTSGGRDSTWTLYVAKKLGLRPLAVHFDNGWNSNIAVTNIHRATEKLDIDLETVVADWEEFKELQLSFLKASVPDVEVPTDVSIHSVMHKIAAKENIKYILNGHSFRTEGVSPIGWTYMDGKYIRTIQKLFGNRKLKDYHNFGIWQLFYYNILKNIQVVPVLNYMPYNQKEVTQILENELGWQYYGGHHHESYYTKFIQSYLLPRKFNIDKRKTEYSALIRSGQMQRHEALELLSEGDYPYDQEGVDYCIAKLGLSKQEWDKIYNLPAKSFSDYPTYYPLMKMLKKPIKLATQLNVLPKLLYLKYLA